MLCETLAVFACVAGLVSLLVRGLSQARLRRLRRLHEQGKCVKCGYDVRSNSTRCPECGADLLKQVVEYWRPDDLR